MTLDPQKLYLSLVDFFSILLPGAVLTYFLPDVVDLALKYGPKSLLNSGNTNSTVVLMVFLFTSYLLGNFAFLLGSFIDEYLYELLRGCTYWGQIQRLVDAKSLSWSCARHFAESKFVFGGKADNAVMMAQRIKARALHGASAEDSINTYQWCKARLSKEHPDGLLAVQNFEASSKFFRSLFIVLVVLVLVYVFVLHNWLAALVGAVLIVFAFLRYVDLRFKGTQQAYWFIITLDATKDPSPVSSVPRLDGLTHAGGVAYRKREGAEKVFEYLLVEAEKDRTQLVLPKGHIEPGESLRVTAVREVREETGYWARVLEKIDDKHLGDAFVCFYLMEVAEAVKSEDERKHWPPDSRQSEWLSPPEWASRSEVHKKPLYDETKDLLNQADLARKRRESELQLKERRTKPFWISWWSRIRTFKLRPKVG
jgi:8-oxo-dGTP pyrophosphatase MutT (NUDIX family)